MCCGFPGGFFGLQDHGDFRRILFSVWDASSEMDQGRDDPSVTRSEDPVEVLYEAPHVKVQRFGGEGAGVWQKFGADKRRGLSCLDDSTGWQVGKPVNMCVVHRSGPEGRDACYAAFVDGVHIVTYQVRVGRKFDGFHSFLQDFRRDHLSPLEPRTAVFGPAWVYTEAAGWRTARRGTFTQSQSEQERRGVESRDSETRSELQG